jgi:hypothetical protein
LHLLQSRSPIVAVLEDVVHVVGALGAGEGACCGVVREAGLGDARFDRGESARPDGVPNPGD